MTRQMAGNLNNWHLTCLKQNKVRTVTFRAGLLQCRTELLNLGIQEQASGLSNNKLPITSRAQLLTNHSAVQSIGATLRDGPSGTTRAGFAQRESDDKKSCQY